MATIADKKLKFTVFGHGYDDDRGNSGTGSKTDTVVLPYGSRYAAFSNDGQYCWVKIDNGNFTKFRTSDWTAVDKGNLPSSIYCVFHPNNTDNNYGLAMDGSSGNGTLYLFNLTTNEIIKSYSNSTLQITALNYDCVISGNTIRLEWLATSGNAHTLLYAIDTDDLSLSYVDIYRAVNGFIDANNIQVYSGPQWFSDHGYIQSMNYSGSYNWSIESSDVGSGTFPNLIYRALTGNGKIYIPTYINNKWRMGEYTGLSAPTLEPPTPIRVFGEFQGSSIDLVGYNGLMYAYSNTRKNCAFASSEGLYVTDFNDLTLIDSGTVGSAWYPLAMTDEMIICKDHYTRQTKVFYF